MRAPSLAQRMIVMAAIGAAWMGVAWSAAYSWQQPHATVDAKGDLGWQPTPFRFEKGASVRYIDFAHGSDSNAGNSKSSPWKHHPWDPAATGKAAACTGVHTYVFKRGVVYRGRMLAKESGRAGDPIRLTRDPAWGTGEAVICGAEQVTGWKRGADEKDIPDRDKVWYADLDFAPRCVWLVAQDGAITRIPLARTPNWKVSDPDDVKSEWWHWDYKGAKPFDVFTQRGKRKLHLGIDTAHLTRSADYYQGAILWTEHGWVMGAPFPTRVETVDVKRKGLGFSGRWGGSGSYKIIRYNRYFLEDKPQYLDDPNGEFWFAKKGDGGRLYLRPPGDADPNQAHIEAAKHLSLIYSEGLSHVYITGLTFRFNNVYWALDGLVYASYGKEMDPACIRLLGPGKDIQVTHCRFEHVNGAVRMRVPKLGDAIDGIVLSDNDIRYTDRGGLVVLEGSGWGEKELKSGLLYDVSIMRNRLHMIGMRPTRFDLSFAINVLCAQTLEVAGNVIEQCYGGGINVHCGKRSAALRDAPLSRVLIHHNKVVDSLLSNDDFGGIETWQGGPAYVYDNISGNPGGYRHFWLLQQPKPTGARFGHAYYLDGAFKNYHFNNIAWGKSKDPYSRLGNTCAFQEIHSYQNTFFNNTVYNFVKGTRRQTPHAGRDKFLGNIWQSIGDWVFWHTVPAKSAKDGNERDAGPQQSHYALETNAYARNVFYNITGKYGAFEPSGRWHVDLDSLRQALKEKKAMACDVGEASTAPLLKDPKAHDFRLRPDGAAQDKGVKVFVPWSLCAMVGEWNFYPAGDDPTRIIDEHWTMTPQHKDRANYYRLPMYPLKGVNVGLSNYVAGPLEDWIKGALRLEGKNQYAVLTQARLGGAPDKTPAAFDAAKIETPDWLSLVEPVNLVPGELCQVSLRLKGIPKGNRVGADLHWYKAGGQYGGFNAWGGKGKPVNGAGPYTFKYKVKSKPGLTAFQLLVFVSPTGEWKDKTKEARIKIPVASGGIGQGAAAGVKTKSPAVDKTNCLFEIYFRTQPGSTNGVLVEKMGRAGFSLSLGATGQVQFTCKGEGEEGTLRSKGKVNDGQWHHVIAEADRKAKTLTLYVDGKQDAQGPGVGPVSLLNQADLYVGGTPKGRCLAIELEFLRICLGTLADAKTTIEELYAWQFNGPQFRDFTGRTPKGRRDAGAIESE